MIWYCYTLSTCHIETVKEEEKYNLGCLALGLYIETVKEKERRAKLVMKFVLLSLMISTIVDG